MNKDVSINAIRNVAFSGVLVWGFCGPQTRTLAVSAMALPAISAFGWWRNDGNISTPPLVVSGNARRRDFVNVVKWPAATDPLIHLIDVYVCLHAVIPREFRSWTNVITRPLQVSFGIWWMSGRLISQWGPNTDNVLHRDHFAGAITGHKSHMWLLALTGLATMRLVAPSAISKLTQFSHDVREIADFIRS